MEIPITTIMAEGYIHHDGLDPIVGKKEWKDITTNLWDEVMRAKKHNSRIKIILEVTK